jgi:hypothetical protein
MIKKEYFSYAPESYKDLGVNVVFFGLHELSLEEKLTLWSENNEGEPTQEWLDKHSFSAYSVFFKPAEYGDYSRMVDIIIRSAYSQDEMEAITNNMAAITAVFMQTLVTDGIVAATKYLKDSINDENTAKFKEMQEWRAMAKKVASEIIKE